MHYLDSIFVQLLKPLDRRSFRASVERHRGDAYCKTFDSWSHLVTLLYAQLAEVRGLRALAAGWNANAHQHYHLGAQRIARSTFADANARRPAAIFEATFERLSAMLERRQRKQGCALLRIIDATPIPLPRLCQAAAFNGRIRGLKLHLVYDPADDRPCRFEITPANVNDITPARQLALQEGATYVYDKAYCHYGWWTAIHHAKAVFVTRPKSNARWRTLAQRPLKQTQGDGFLVLEDRTVALDSKGDSKLDIPLRLITLRRDNDKTITLLSNDMKRSAVEIAALYKARWQIETLFRWIKQNLRIKSFLGRSENAVRLQLIAALIAFALLRIASRRHNIEIAPIRFVQLVGYCLFQRKPLDKIDQPPPVNPSKPKSNINPNQGVLGFV
jgi:IS4 transposase